MDKRRLNTPSSSEISQTQGPMAQKHPDLSFNKALKHLNHCPSRLNLGQQLITLSKQITLSKKESLWLICTKPGFYVETWLKALTQNFAATQIKISRIDTDPSAALSDAVKQIFKTKQTDKTKKTKHIDCLLSHTLPEAHLSSYTSIGQKYVACNESHFSLNLADLVYLCEQLQTEGTLNQVPDIQTLNHYLDYTQGWVAPLVAGLLGAHESDKDHILENFKAAADQQAQRLVIPILNTQDLKFFQQFAIFKRITPKVLKGFDKPTANLSHCYQLVDRQILTLIDYSKAHFGIDPPVLASAIEQICATRFPTSTTAKTQPPPTQLDTAHLDQIFTDYRDAEDYKASFALYLATQHLGFIQCINQDPWGFLNALPSQAFAQIALLAQQTQQKEGKHLQKFAVDPRLLHCLHQEAQLIETLCLKPRANTPDLHQEITQGTLNSAKETPTNKRIHLGRCLLEKLLVQTQTHNRNESYQQLMHIEQTMAQEKTLNQNPVLKSALGKLYLDCGILSKAIEHLGQSSANALSFGLSELLMTNQIYLGLCHFWCANQNQLYKMCYNTRHHFSPATANSELQPGATPIALNLWSEICVFHYRIEQSRAESATNTVDAMVQALTKPAPEILKFFLLMNVQAWRIHQNDENAMADANKNLSQAQDILSNVQSLTVAPLWSIFIFSSGLQLIANLKQDLSALDTKSWIKTYKPMVTDLFDAQQMTSHEPNLWACIAQLMLHFIQGLGKPTKESIKHISQIAAFAKERNYRLVNLYANIFLAMLLSNTDAQDEAQDRFFEALDIAEPFNLSAPFILLARPLMKVMYTAKQTQTARHFLNQIFEQLDEQVNRLSHHLDKLSKRELEILGLIAKGMTNEEIATTLNRSKGTIKLHVHNIYKKIDTKNRIEAIQNYVDWKKNHSNLKSTSSKTNKAKTQFSETI